MLPRGACTGLGPDEWHVRDALVMRRAFQQQLMVAEEIAMVGGENDDGVVGQSAGGEPREHAADGVVDHRDHAAAQRHRLAGFALVDGEGGLAGGVGLAAGRARASAQATGRASARLPAWKLGGSAMSFGSYIDQ